MTKLCDRRDGGISVGRIESVNKVARLRWWQSICWVGEPDRPIGFYDHIVRFIKFLTAILSDQMPHNPFASPADKAFPHSAQIMVSGIGFEFRARSVSRYRRKIC